MPESRESWATSVLPPNVRETVVTVGSFDGIHRGHHALLARVVDRSRDTGLPSVLISFDPHPLEVVRPAEAPRLLTSWEEKMELLAQLGLDYVVKLPFNQELSRYSAEQFVEEVLLRRVHMRDLIIGHDHGFGRGRTGDAESLQLIGARRGFSVGVIGPVLNREGIPISSTIIRRALERGDYDSAVHSLGRFYSVSGKVVKGRGRGRGLGFPTINVVPHGLRKLLPRLGVYAVRVQTPVGAVGGMLNLGPRPTFQEDETALEAHLFDFDRDLYGATVRLDFIAPLRETKAFASAGDLRSQLVRDEAMARDALTPWVNTNNINSYTRNPG